MRRAGLKKGRLYIYVSGSAEVRFETLFSFDINVIDYQRYISSSISIADVLFPSTRFVIVYEHSLSLSIARHGW